MNSSWNRMKRNFIKICPILFAIFANLTMIFADESPFKWKAEKNDNKISIQVQIPENYYLYLERSKVQVESSDGKKLLAFKLPKSESYFDEFQEENHIYKAGEHKWVFNISGTAPYLVKIKYQGCSKKPFLCYPPEEKEIEIDGGFMRNALDSVLSEGKKLGNLETPKTKDELKLGDENSFITKIAERGGFFFFLAVFVGGILSTFTPCVLPLIPITVAIFSGGKTASNGASFLKALSYVLGIMLMFTALAALAAFSGKAFGSQILGNRIFIFAFASIFFLLALSMLGLYELQLPSSLQTRLNSIGGNGALGAFLMGLVAGLIAVPCTGPVLGTLLGIAAASANPLFSILLLLTYAFGFGLPFLFFALGVKIFPQKNGKFMEMVKSLLGIIIMTGSIYVFAIAIRQFNGFLSGGFLLAKIISLLCIVAGFLFGAVHADGHSPKLMVKFAKIAGAILISFGIVWNLKTNLSAGDTLNSVWKKYDESLQKEAIAKKKYILLDFGAEWCAACKEMDATTLQDKNVTEELSSRWIAMKIDGTINSPEIEKLQKKYKVKGYPGFVVLSPSGEVKGGFTGYHNADDFLAKIKSLRELKN